jgi:single-strand DNA-binding protein
MNLNCVHAAGNLTKDPEVTFTTSGTAKGKFSIAVNSQYKDKSGEMKKEVEFLNIVCWGATAENCSKFLTKGSNVFVEGRIKTRSWETDGKKHYATEIQADRVHFLTKKESE